MSHNGSLLVAVLLAWVLIAAFWPSKPLWRPFGGMWKWDKRKGTLSVVVPLPTKKGRKR